MKKRILIGLFAVLVLAALLSAWLLLRNTNPYGRLLGSLDVSDVEKFSIFSNTRPLREAELDGTETEQLAALLNSLALPADPAHETEADMTGAKPESYAIHIRLKDSTDLVLVPMNYAVSSRKNEAFYVIYPHGDRYGYPADEAPPITYPADDAAAFRDLLDLCRTLHNKYFP